MTKKTSSKRKAKSFVKKVKKTGKRKPRKAKAEKTPPLVLVKSLNGPIISPKAENGWEAWQTFNAGTILLNGKVHFLYRAIGKDAISRLGYAVSCDGFKIDERLSQPAYEHPLVESPPFNLFSFASGGSFGGCEDARPVRVNQEDILYMTYTACDQGLRMALTSIKVSDFLNKKWLWKKPVFISPAGQVHKNWVMFPEKIGGRYAILHSLNPKIAIAFFDSLELDGSTCINSYYDPKPQGGHWNWEGKIRGAGPPPLKTKDGWLVFYHAEDKRDPGKYKVGAMLLDLKDPANVLCCAKEPIIEPKEIYENNGFKSGVVYASGAVIKNGNLLVYYGGADSYVCVAHTNFEKFLESLRKETKPKLKRKVLRKK